MLPLLLCDRVSVVRARIATTPITTASVLTPLSYQDMSPRATTTLRHAPTKDPSPTTRLPELARRIVGGNSKEVETAVCRRPRTFLQRPRPGIAHTPVLRFTPRQRHLLFPCHDSFPSLYQQTLLPQPFSRGWNKNPTAAAAAKIPIRPPTRMPRLQPRPPRPSACPLATSLHL